MSYLESLRGIINEINIGNDTGDNNPPTDSDDTSDEGNENFMDDDNEDTSTDDSSDTPDENEGNENFMDDDSDSDDTTTDDSSDTNDDTSDEGDENFMDDDSSEGDDESQPSEEEDSSDDEGGNEDFMDSGDDTSDEGDGGEGSEEESQSSDEEGSDDDENDEDYDINKIEDELFSSLTPEQIAIKNHELKNQFIELYSIIGSTLVRINDISKTNENINVLKFITEKLLELREMVDFNVTTAYQTRTYIENNIIYQQCIATLNAIADIIENIPKLNDNNNKADDEEIENKGEPVEKDKETSDFLNVSDSSMSDYQEESTDYNTLF